MSEEVQQPFPKERLYYLDNLRIFLTGLVICHHTAIAFGAPGGWYYRVEEASGVVTAALLTLFVAVNQSFFMSLFFLVSAYFAAGSYERKGPTAFLKDRLLRLGIPLVVYFLLLNVSVMYLVLRFRGEIPAGYFAFLSTDLLRRTGTGPMWFVMSLLVFEMLYVAAKPLLSRLRLSEGPRALPRNGHILLFIAVVGVIAFLVRLPFPVGWGFCNLQFAYYPLYICMYVFGMLAFRLGWLERLSSRQANLWFAVALGMIALIPVIMVLGGALTTGVEPFNGGLHWQAYVYAALEPFLCIGISMKLLVMFRDRLNKTNGVAGAMARSAYTAYIIHPFFVVVASHMMAGVELHTLLRLAILFPAVVGSCFFVSSLIRQLPLLRRIL